MQKYKAVQPEDTIKRISGIIKATGIPTIDQVYGDGDMFCSYRLNISKDDYLAIGTNGKGMTPIYAKASAYAEMMERLQNRVVIDPNPARHCFDCVYFPDESHRVLDKGEIVNYVHKLLPSAYPLEGIEVDSIDCTFLPFYHVNSSEIVDIPYTLIRSVSSSNGMAAGNIPEEAILQGLSEIFERHSLQELYLKRLTPPTIPSEEFRGTIIGDKLNTLKKEYGMECIIKDCSLGEGFPVIGLLIYNENKTKYVFQLGSALSRTVALERCFTEAFQGHTAKSLEFLSSSDIYQPFDSFNEFRKSLVYGRGQMPKEFFNETPSYEYNRGSIISFDGDFKYNLKQVINWITGKSYDIYIRDNSFLGFPAYHIIIPGMSELSSHFSRMNPRLFELKYSERMVNPLYRLPSLSDAEIRIAVRLLSDNMKDSLNIFPHNSNRNNHINRHLLLAILYYRIGEDKKSLECFENYVRYQKQSGKQVRRHYQYIISLLKGENLHIDEPEINIAWYFVNNRKDVLKMCCLPDCYNCEKCAIQDGCKYNLLHEVECKIQECMKAGMPDQSLLYDVFN